MQQRPTEQKPKNAKNLTTAFLVLAVVMVGAQALNLIITLLPAAADTTLQVDPETTVAVASLRGAYISSTLIVALIYGLVWFWLRRSKNWARWIAVTLAALAAVGGVQGLAQVFGAGSTNMAAVALSLAQLVAAGWVLALVLRKDVDTWFRKTAKPARVS